MSWRIAVTRESTFGVAALEEAIARHGCPAIMNTDPGSPFTSAAFTGLLLDRGIHISMDGRGCWRDNIFVERLWRSLTYEEVYLHGDDSVSAATAGIARYVTLYHSRRPHSSLNDCPPEPRVLCCPLSRGGSLTPLADPLRNALRLYREAEPLHWPVAEFSLR